MIGRLFRRGDSQPRPSGRRSWLRRAFGLDRILGLALLTASIFLYYWNPYPVQFMRVKTFDLYQRILPRDIPPPEKQIVTIVDLDERSLREIGQWPWPRSVIAQMVANLMNSGAGMVAFDVVFPEEDRMNPSSVAQSLVGLDDDTRSKISALPSVAIPTLVSLG